MADTAATVVMADTVDTVAMVAMDLVAAWAVAVWVWEVRVVAFIVDLDMAAMVDMEATADMVATVVMAGTVVTVACIVLVDMVAAVNQSCCH